MIQTVEVPQGTSRTVAFRIRGLSGGWESMAEFQSVSVVVDAADGTDAYTADCPQQGTDVTTRLVTIEGAGSAELGKRDACVHWIDAAGKPGAWPFRVQVIPHA